MVRRHQPQVVISPRSGWRGDFDVVEGDAIVTGPIRPRAWEQCFSINRNAWGYTTDQRTLSGNEVIVRLVEVVVRGGNLLPNLGPDPDGRIPAEQQRTLRELGAWMRQHGEAVQGTRAGPLQPVDGVWGTTQRGDRVYLHVSCSFLLCRARSAPRATCPAAASAGANTKAAWPSPWPRRTAARR